MSGEQKRLMALQFAESSSSYPPIEKLDDNVLAALPPGIEVLSIEPSGASGWVQTVRIETLEKDGSIKVYFQKIQSGEAGRRMMEGSYESEKIFHHYSPAHVPRPVAWGAYTADPNMWYYICDFHEMEDEWPEAKALVPIIVQVHKASMGKSPNGMHGFHVPTHLANLPNDNTWQTSWETWFAQAMRRMFELEGVAHEKDPKLESLKKDLYDKVIPRLLRPLETGGRSIQPCLIHSDLWPGNIKPDADTNEIMIFDSCAFWGHNEADLGTWRAPRYKFGRPFVKEYQKAMGISEPRGDWDDRNALYAILSFINFVLVGPLHRKMGYGIHWTQTLTTVAPSRYDILVSALYAQDLKFRSMAMAEMQRLVDKYPDGFEGFERQPALSSTLSTPAQTRAKSESDILAVAKEAKEPSHQVREMDPIPALNRLTCTEWNEESNITSSD